MRMVFGEAVVACDMPEPCEFPSIDSCQKRFLWTHKGVDLASHPVIGLVLQVGDAETFPKALGTTKPSCQYLIYMKPEWNFECLQFSWTHKCELHWSMPLSVTLTPFKVTTTSNSENDDSLSWNVLILSGPHYVQKLITWMGLHIIIRFSLTLAYIQEK